MKLGIVVGHTSYRTGAFSQYLNSAEYAWNRELAKRIESQASEVLTKVFLRDEGGIAGAYYDSDNWGSDLAVELHFNSSDNSHDTGTGVLYHPDSAKSKELATLLCQEIRVALGLPDWPAGTGGVVTPLQAFGEQRKGQRSLTAGRAPAALIEPFFGSNKNDCQVAEEKKDALAKAVIVAATRAWNSGR
jgi:N-acetylmuramoyl-L-alanine amidase